MPADGALSAAEVSLHSLCSSPSNTAPYDASPRRQHSAPLNQLPQKVFRLAISPRHTTPANPPDSGPAVATPTRLTRFGKEPHRHPDQCFPAPYFNTLHRALLRCPWNLVKVIPITADFLAFPKSQSPPANQPLLIGFPDTAMP